MNTFSVFIIIIVIIIIKLYRWQYHATIWVLHNQVNRNYSEVQLLLTPTNLS